MSAIFISHSSRDSDTAADISRRLTEAGHRSVFLDFDPEMGIPAGRDWEKELYWQLRSCRAVVALLSPHWTNSRWCFAEITMARSLGKYVIPVKIAPLDVDPIVDDRQAIDLTQGPEEALARLNRGLVAAGLQARDSFDWDPQRSPYPGLLAFQERDAAVYFGRGGDIDSSLDVIGRVQRYGETGLVVFLGASGSGKSSLMRAGIIPRLKHDPDRWLVLDTMRPGLDPIKEVAAVIARAYRGLGRQIEWQEVHRRLTTGDPGDRADGRASSLNDVIEDLRLGATNGDTTVVLPVDQFEELLDGAPNSTNRSFMSLIHDSLVDQNPSLLVLATLRSDFLEAFQQTPELGRLDARRIVIGGLGTEQLVEIVEKPAEIAGVELGQGVVQALISDAETPDALPLLAFTLRQLYEGYADDSLITVEEYRDQLGGLQASVGKAANALLPSAGLPAAGLEDLRNAFLAMVRVDEAGHYSRRAAAWQDLPKDAHPLLERFVRARLLISRGDGITRTVEVAHEALFRTWDLLRRWLDDHADALRLRQEVEIASQRWDEHERSEEYLWRGARLGRAIELRDTAAFALPDLVLEFLHASDQAQNRARRVRSRRRKAIVASAVGVAVVMSSLALRERSARRNAELLQQLALSGQLALESQNRLDDRVDLALLLGVEAFEAAKSPEAQGSLLTGLLRNPHVRAFLAGGEQAVDDLAFSPDGSLIAATQASSIALYDAFNLGRDGDLLTRGIDDILESYLHVAFSNDGNTVAASTAGDDIVLWDVSTRQEIGHIDAGRGLSVDGIAFAPGDTTLISGGCQGLIDFTACNDGEIRVWNTRTFEERRPPLEQPGRGVSSIVVLGDDRVLAGNRDGSITEWSLSGNTIVRSLVGHAARVGHLALDPTGQTLASASDDSTVGVWDLTQSAPEPLFLRGHTAHVKNVVFHPMANIVASVADDETVRFWDSRTGSPFSPILRTHTAAINSLAMSPSGETFASGDGDGTLVVWDMADRQSIQRPLYFDAHVVSIAESQDGRFLAVGFGDGTVRSWEDDEVWLDESIGENDQMHVAFNAAGTLLAVGGCVAMTDAVLATCTDGAVWTWDLETGSSKKHPSPHEARITSLAFDPMNRSLVSGDDDGRFVVWRLPSLTPDTTIEGHNASIKDLAFSPDGQLLATAGYDGLVGVWNTTTWTMRDQLAAHEPSTALTVAFSPDGSLLASGGGDKRVVLWDVESLSPASPPLLAHTNSVFDLEFDIGGDVLASAGFDSTVILWSVSGQGELGRLREHTEAVEAVLFGRDSTTLYSGGRDGRFVVWDASADSWAEVACARANRNLALSEWRQYLGTQPYRKTCDQHPVHPSIIEWGKQLALNGDLDGSRAVFAQLSELEPESELEPDAEVARWAGNGLMLEAQQLARAGRVEEAVAAYEQGLGAIVPEDIPGAAWNTICWFGSLHGHHETVMTACNHGVELSSGDEEAQARDSRGVARALAGDYEGATDDFRSFVEWTIEVGIYNQYGRERDAWIQKLMERQNPFDSVTIARLRIE